MWRRRMLILSVFLAVVSHAAAEEAYTLKFKGRSTGQRVLVDKTETKQGHLKTIFTDEETLKEEKHKDTVATRYTQTVLECRKSDGAPVRLRRVYEKAMTREDDGKIRFAPFHGKAVLIERNKNDFPCRLEDGEALSGEAATLLGDLPSTEENSELSQLIIPREPIPVGGEWKIDARRVAAIFGSPNSPEASKGSGRLARVYQKDGRRYGVLVIHLDLGVKGAVDIAAGKANFKPGSRVLFDVVQDCCIDGTRVDTRREMTMTVEVVSTGKVDDRNVRMTGSMQVRSRASFVEILDGR
jgi:hypothetical protein